MNYMKYELKDTKDLMVNDDYIERFKAEYYQLKIRYEKLKQFNTKIEVYNDYYNQSDLVNHDTPREILKEQQKIMGEYLHILEMRAVFEGIEL